MTLRNVGAAGGQAAAFTYDLARSVVGTRQGDLGLAGQELDGLPTPIRSDDLFWPGDWLDLDKVAIPQADEQQRLLANLITQMNLDRTPLPRFWYLPRGEKAAVVLTGDDHARGDRAPQGQFERFLGDSPPGCSVADVAVRALDLLRLPRAHATSAPRGGAGLPGRRLRDRAAPARLGPNTGAQECNDFALRAGPRRARRPDDASWQAFHDSVAGPGRARHEPHPLHRLERLGDRARSSSSQHGIRLDTNYYYWPGGCVQNTAGHVHRLGLPDALRRPQTAR